MFKKLHLQLTFFCTAIISLLLIIMSIAYLSVSESTMRINNHDTFLKDSNTIITYLSDQSTLSFDWIAVTEFNNQFIIDIVDNGIPLFITSLNKDSHQKKLVSQARTLSADLYGLDLDTPLSSTILTKQIDFKMTDANDSVYYVTTAVIPKEDGQLSLVLIQSSALLEKQILHQRILFLFINLLGILFIVVFSLFFTKRMITPLEKNREHQASFVAAASHELRAPLTVMLSSLSAMKQADPIQAQRFSDTIQAEGELMSRLINDMLILASADNYSWTINICALDLETLLLDTYENYEPIAKKNGLRLNIQLPATSSPKCRGDKMRIEQVLSILLNNAISYTPKGGSIFLELLSKGNKLELRIIDTGPGIPDENKEQIFHRFFRVDKSHNKKNHFGLGLSIASEIIKLHKGKILVEDTPGGGATFIISLPIFHEPTKNKSIT